MSGAALPPSAQSRAALGLVEAAAEGRLALQACAACGTLQYPPRDACRRCLSVDLRWQDVRGDGTLLAKTTVRVPASPGFAGTMPRVGTVLLDAGPRVVAFLGRDVVRDGRVRLELRLDRGGGPVFVAFPAPPTPASTEDDQMIAATTADPRQRHVLLTDARSADAPALAAALRAAGAASVVAGEAPADGPNPHREALLAAGAEIAPLDVADTASVEALAAAVGGRVDILVNNARRMRPGGIGAGTALARELLEVNALGLLRLAEAFGPALRARGAEAAAAGTVAAPAWVNILSVDALSPPPGTAAFAASEAAALSLARALRADLAAHGVRVVTVLVGPTDDEAHRALPPPKVAAATLARAVVDALSRGLEEVAVGDVARDAVERWLRAPKALERELARGG